MDSCITVLDSTRELSWPLVNWGTIGAAIAEPGSSKTSNQALVNFQLDLGGQNRRGASVTSCHGCLA